MLRSRAISGSFILTVGFLLCGGCAKTNIFEVSGTVTFDGKPVPAGRVDFFPDFAAGNDGPQGFALIKDGVFDTRNGGQGHGGGAMLIRIEGFDGKTDDPRFFGTPIFGVHQIPRDMPREASVQTLEVPASAADGLVVPTRPKS